jgi:hypothetical protein
MLDHAPKMKYNIKFYYSYGNHPEGSYSCLICQMTSNGHQAKCNPAVCKICGFHSSDYEEWCLLGCYVMWFLSAPTFRRNLAPPSSELQESVN